MGQYIFMVFLWYVTLSAQVLLYYFDEILCNKCSVLFSNRGSDIIPPSLNAYTFDDEEPVAGPSLIPDSPTEGSDVIVTSVERARSASIQSVTVSQIQITCDV